MKEPYIVAEVSYFLRRQDSKFFWMKAVSFLSSVADSSKNLSNKNKSMKFCGFKGQMMSYPKKRLDMKQFNMAATIQDGG